MEYVRKVDFEAIENPFASSKKMMMDSPPQSSTAPIYDYKLQQSMDEGPNQGENSVDSLPEMNGSATITRPSAHSKTKTRVPPHKAKRSANTKLSTDSEIAAKLSGAGDAPSQESSLNSVLDQFTCLRFRFQSPIDRYFSVN